MSRTSANRPGAGRQPSQATSPSLATGSGAPEVVARNLEQVIGARVRDSRKLAGLTLAELAAAADLSTAMLSRIENGQISPSLNTLQLLSGAINMPLSMLLASVEESRGCSYVKAGHGVSIRRRGTKVGHQYTMLGQSIGGAIAVEPYLIVLDQSAEPYTEFRHEGIEYLHMLSGVLDYRHGERSYRLEPGDSLLFDSAEFHGPETLHELPATYLSIIVYART
ncbi:MAG: XRE family transcriptional regulator [Hyphomicrobiaceae bacterium]|nr:XRE family transcriptional regulator [Hyphomicrobiaceae bacterium]